MNNLIMNSRWLQSFCDGPLFFSGDGTTYDRLCVNGCRTCSCSQTEGMRSFDQYDPSIPVCGRNGIQWGYTIRCADADCIYLQADFYDAAGCLIDTQREEIAESVSCEFSRQMARFTCPCHADSVKLSMHFRGDVTACTFFAPTAYYC